MRASPFLVAVLIAGPALAAKPAEARRDGGAPGEVARPGAEPRIPAGCTARKSLSVTPEPNARVTHVTHAWPHCSPCVKLQPRPAFLLRLDRLIEPGQVLAAIDVVGGPSLQWRKLEWTLKACVVEAAASGSSAMTLIFQPTAPLPAGTYDWLVPGEVARPLHWGVSTTNRQAGGVFVVGEPVGAKHPDASIAAQLAAPRDPAEVYAHLRNARESLAMVREWGDLQIPRAADDELAAREAEFRSLRGDAPQPLPLFTPRPPGE